MVRTDPSHMPTSIVGSPAGRSATGSGWPAGVMTTSAGFVHVVTHDGASTNRIVFAMPSGTDAGKRAGVLRSGKSVSGPVKTAIRVEELSATGCSGVAYTLGR